MKSPIILLESLFTDVKRWCGVNMSRDLVTIQDRFEHEGWSFLTITLPAAGKAFDASLEAQIVHRSTFPWFKHQGKEALPCFCKGLLSMVFDPITGLILEDPCLEAIWLLRQIFNLFKKIELECTPERTQAAFDKYASTDEEIGHLFDTIPLDEVVGFEQIASILLSTRLTELSQLVESRSLTPKHGPGKTADRLMGNHKYEQSVWHERLEFYFPAIRNLFPNDMWYDELQGIQYLAAKDELPVRVVAVPKTLSAPRIIAIEPTCMQYAQQAVLEALVPLLEGPSFHGALGFTDQSPNKALAEIGSRDKSVATLDLSDASDRVHVRLASSLFTWNWELHDAIMACRSTHACVPGHGIIKLHKFASMGSALCFPIEALTFLVITLKAMHRFDGVSANANTVERYLKDTVRVYGDDIIVPTRYASTVIDELEVFGLRVNRTKTFQSGNFRESCGGDYYSGMPVKPVYMRQLLPHSRRHVKEMISLASTMNQFYMNGLWSTAELLHRWFESLAPNPILSESSQALGRRSLCFSPQPTGWIKSTQQPAVKALVTKAPLPECKLDGVGALMKFFLKRGNTPTEDKNHLNRSGRPLRVYTREAWVPFM